MFERLFGAKASTTDQANLRRTTHKCLSFIFGATFNSSCKIDIFLIYYPHIVQLVITKQCYRGPVAASDKNNIEKGQRPAIFVANVEKIIVVGAAHRNILRCAAPTTNVSLLNLQIFRRAAAYMNLSNAC